MKKDAIKTTEKKVKQVRESSKDFIIKEAFKLFIAKTYEQVTYNDLEAATGLVRGTILYHFKTKENLFKQVVDRYLFSTNSITRHITLKKMMTFLEFIDLYTVWIENTQTSLRSMMGIENMNAAFFNLTASAQHYYKNFDVKAIKYHQEEIQVWINVIQDAIASGEINPMINIATYSRLFQDLYYGSSYSSIISPSGIDTQQLEKEMLEIYRSIKN
jgi:AcrR family transcriptional regulator